MPKRVNKSRNKIDSTEVQGEGSWVVLRNPTFPDMESLMKQGVSTEALIAGDFSAGLKLLETLVEDWNWVDDNDEPFPKPTPELVRALPFQEVTFLTKNLDMGQVKEKN